MIMIEKYCMVINKYENNTSDNILLRKVTANTALHIIQDYHKTLPYGKATVPFSMQ